jgi:hypothetical protein
MFAERSDAQKGCFSSWKGSSSTRFEKQNCVARIKEGGMSCVERTFLSRTKDLPPPSGNLVEAKDDLQKAARFITLCLISR